MTKYHLVNIGQKFNYWTVIKPLPLSRNKARKFLCQCQCGTQKEVYYSHLVRSQSRSCGCMQPKKNSHYNWTGCGDLTGDHWNQIVRNATGKKNRIPIGITLTIKEAWELFLQQKKKCNLTGLEIKLGRRGESTASLDRIDPNKGYHLSNVQWIHKDINRMKNIFQQDYFIKMCKYVADSCEI